MKFNIVLSKLRKNVIIIASCVLIIASLDIHFAFAQSVKSKDGINFKTLFPAAPVENKRTSNVYETDDEIRFTLDRTNPDYALLKFETNDEVWFLKPSIGPRGDEFYKNDAGQVLLRFTSLGGITLYVNNIREGLAVSRISRAQTIEPINNGYKGTLQALAEREVFQFNPKLMPNLRIEITGGLPSYLVADAIDRAQDAVNSMNPDLVKSRNIRLIRINRGAQAYAIVNDNCLELGLTPGISYAGRPSSILIKRAIINN